MVGARLAVVVAALIGCREPASSERAPAIADQALTWPAIDDGALQAARRAVAGAAVPEPIALAPDGSVVYRRGGELHQLDATGKATKLFGGGMTAAIDVSPDAARIVAPAGDHLVAVERVAGTARDVAVGPGAVVEPHLSPDGSQLAFARDGDVWVMALDAAKPTRLTQHPPEHEYGTAEPAARAFGRTRGHWWSPDGRAIAFQRTDARAVEPLVIADPRHPEQPPVAMRYARAGKPIASVDLGIARLAGGPTRWVTWDRARFPYLARVIWPAKGPLTLVVADRAQTDVAVLAVDPQAGTTRVLLEDKHPTWVDVAPEPVTWLEDGSGFLWMTESSGAWSLEQHAADGKHVRQLVAPSLGLRRVVGISGRDVIVEAAADSREQHVWRVPLAGGEPIALTTGGDVNRAIAAHGSVAIRSSRTAMVLRADGTRGELPGTGERPPADPTTELLNVTLDDHSQFAAITRPRTFDAKVRYAVLLVGDAGPRGKNVLAARDRYLVDQWYADAGFVVVRTDGRGTPDRGRDWSQAVSTDLMTKPMTDAIDTLNKLGGMYPQLDLARVGVVGEDFGGYFAVMAVLLHPEVFAAAIATSPIVDWELHDAAFTERYLRTPVANAEGYRRCSAIVYAERLTKPLMIAHALGDRDIHAAHSLALLEAVQAAGKQADFVVLPAGADPQRDRRQLEFLRRHLGPPVRPGVMPKARTESEEEEERERRRGKIKGGDKDRDESVDEH